MPIAPVDAVPRPGDLVADKYQIERVLGEGGMGMVVAAWHTGLRKRVAIKFLLPRALALPGATGRFLREAQAVAALQNEHVARVLDVGTLQSGMPYMVMEHLTGENLEEALTARGRLDPHDAVDYVLQACEAIAEAHAIGIVHRDLKPANLFVTSRKDGTPLVKVLDFGLSKAMSDDAPGANVAGLTVTHVIAGSPQYMSPEQVRSLKHVDVRTDVWALGVILYELLLKRRPFDGSTLPAIIASIMSDTPAPPRSVRPDLPARLEEIILRCLEKDQGKRVQTVSELARALEPFGSAGARLSVERTERMSSGDRISAIFDEKSQPTAPDNHETASSLLTTMVHRKPVGPKLVVAIAIVASLLVVGIAAWAVLLARHERESAGMAPNASSSADTVPPPERHAETSSGASTATTSGATEVAPSASPENGAPPLDVSNEPGTDLPGKSAVTSSKSQPNTAAPLGMSTPPSASVGEFNRGAATAALGTAAGSAKACKKPGGPSGTGRVKIVFAPSGKVTSAQMEGPPFAGTVTGSCIERVFRGVRVPAFTGPPVAVGKSITIS